MQKHPKLSYAAFALLCLIWGSTWLVIKVGYGGLGPFNVAALRFLVAGLLMSGLAPAMGAKWPKGREQWRLTVWVGVLLFGADYGLIYFAEQKLDSGITALLFAVLPIITALAAHVYLPGERLTARKLAGTLLAFVGVGALFADNLHVDATKVWSMVAVVVGTACAALTSVATKRHGQSLHPAALNAPAMLVGAGLLALTSLIEGDGFHAPANIETWGAILYLAVVGSVIAFLLYFWLLKLWRATSLSFISVFNPITAMILGTVVLHERLTIWTAVGAAIVLAGVILAQTRT